MRILQVAYKSEITGGEKVLFILAKHFRNRGHDLSVVCPTHGPLVGALRKEGIEVNVIPIKKSYDFVAALRLRDLMRRKGIQILHSHGMLVNIVGRMASRLGHVPVSLSTVHLTRELVKGGRAENARQRLKANYYRAVDNFTAQFNDRVIAVSESVRQDLICQGVRSDRVIVIKNGIEFDRQSPYGRKNRQAEMKRELDIGNCSIVGTITRFSKQKDVQTFLYAMSIVVRRYPDVRCLILGDGERRKELEDLNHRLALNRNVTFMGYREDAREILDLFDVFVLSSLWEGLPLVVLEAMAASKPVIATNVPGTSEVVIDGETGLLVPLRDSKRLAESIMKLLVDQRLAHKMGMAGRHRVHKYFSAERMADETERLYLDLMSFKKKKEIEVRAET